MNHSLIPTAQSGQLSFSHLRIKVHVYTRSLVLAGIISTLLYNVPKTSAECFFTAGFDVVENVAVVVVQVSVENKPHGELCENKTQLRGKREREKAGTHDQLFQQLLNATQRTRPGPVNG